MAFFLQQYSIEANYSKLSSRGHGIVRANRKGGTDECGCNNWRARIGDHCFK